MAAAHARVALGPQRADPSLDLLRQRLLEALDPEIVHSQPAGPGETGHGEPVAERGQGLAQDDDRLLFDVQNRGTRTPGTLFAVERDMSTSSRTATSRRSFTRLV